MFDKMREAHEAEGTAYTNGAEAMVRHSTFVEGVTFMLKCHSARVQAVQAMSRQPAVLLLLSLA